MTLKQPTLTLVGAGPGDPELITLKGIKALQQADVVLYDALAHPDLLKYAPPWAILEFVGKRSGKKSTPQDEINRKIVSNAHQHGHVVRLKGGDPFVFARGYEEIEYARQFGVQTRAIPGISTATGLTGHLQIPLTLRGLNESFVVVTATASEDKLSADIRCAAKSEATVVILMGLKKLPYISQLFADSGRANIPAAVVQSGTLANQKVAYGPISQLAQIAQEHNITTPATIIVGEVVRLGLSDIVEREKKFAHVS